MAWSRQGSTRHTLIALFVRESAKAIFVTDTGDESDGVWLPKSQISYDYVNEDEVRIDAPEWLLMEKGLI
jgi:hypothetical protein